MIILFLTSCITNNLNNQKNKTVSTLTGELSFMSGILDHTEGPANNTMQIEFKGLVEEAAATDKVFQKAIEPELKKFAKLTK